MGIKNILISLSCFLLTSNVAQAQNHLDCPVRNMKIGSESHSPMVTVSVKSNKKEVYSLVSGTVKNISDNSGRIVIAAFDSTFAIYMYTFDKIRVHTGDTVTAGDYLGDMLKLANRVYILKLFYHEDDGTQTGDFRSLLCACRKHEGN